MPTPHEVFNAVPTAGPINYPLLRNFLINRVPYTFKQLPGGTFENPGDFVALDSETGAIPGAVVYRGVVFMLDPDDTTSAPDLILVIRTYDGYCYKAGDLESRIRSVRSRTVDTPPTSGAERGDAYILPAAPQDEWSSYPDHMAILSGRGWVYRYPSIGEWIYVEDETRFVRFDLVDGWTAGPGGRTFDTESIPYGAAINFGHFVLIEHQNLEKPPGSRVTGGTPTAPLGGTAASFNDDNTATITTTSALGNLSAASVASRVMARIDLGSVKNLIGIEAKQVKTSTGSSAALGCGLYYSTDGTTWNQLGTGFTITATPADFVRTGNVTARYVALVTSQTNWSTATNSFSDLNAFDDTITISKATAYVVGANPIGVLAGQTGKIVVAEAENEITIYDPPLGMRAYDRDEAADFRYGVAGWERSTGTFIVTRRTFTANGTWNKPNRLIFVIAHPVGGGGGSSTNGSPAGNGGLTSFGSHCSAAGGGGTNGTNPGIGGLGSGGVPGIAGGDGTRVQTGTSEYALGGAGAGPFGGQQSIGAGKQYGGGAGAFETGGGAANAGAGGGYQPKVILAEDLGTSEAVTVGGGGAGAAAGSAGAGGVLVIDEYTEA